MAAAVQSSDSVMRMRDRTQVHLGAPPDTPEGHSWRYGVGFPFQVAPALAGVLAGIEIACTDNYGFLNGSDLVLFGDLSNATERRTVPLTRNAYPNDPATGTEKPRLLLRSPMIGGFVPLRATRPDGAMHPHGGTGFGIWQALSFPLSEVGMFNC